MERTRSMKVISIVLAILLIITLMPLTSSAATSKAGTPEKVSYQKTSNGLEHNFISVSTKGSKVTIRCETPLKTSKYNINVRKVSPKAAYHSKWIKRVTAKKKSGGYYAFTTSFTAKQIGSAGSYVIVITKASNHAVIYKNCNIRVKNGKVSILKYNKILNENSKATSSNVKKSYSDPYMKDIRTRVFRDPKTKKVAYVKDYKVAYFKKVSKSITKGAKTDYEKALKIYEYVGKNFYYDTIAFQTGRLQYVDPYRNLFNLRNKKSSANSTSSGKVATTCLGYSALIIALCRAQGIPARLVAGHHVKLNKTYHNWNTEKSISKRDHWWAQVYVDGRWIDIDATTANSNKWNRSSKKWTYTGLTNYVYFDPTKKQLASSHQITSII